MFYLIVGIFGIFMGFFGFISNLYILLVIVISKKARSISEWILLHLSSCGIGASLLQLCFSSPSILLGKWISAIEPLCDIVGASILILQLLTVWSICALSVDRCSAIVSPLRYTQVVTRKRVAAFFIIFWCLSITMVVMAFSISSAYETYKSKNQDATNTFYFNGPSSNPTITTTTTTTTATSTTIKNNYNLDEINRISFLTRDPKKLIEFQRFKHSTEDFYSSWTKYHYHNNESLSLYFAAKQSLTNNLSKMISSESVGEVDGNDVDNEDNNNEFVQSQESKSESESTSLIYSKENLILTRSSSNFSTKYRPSLGFCLPNIYYMSWVSFLWIGEWTILIFIAPLCTLLVCDLTVLSIAKKQRHRIVMALYQITLSAQATVTRSKGTAPPSLWMTNRAVPAKSRACRAVWEDVATIIFLNLPLIIILVIDSIFLDVVIPLAFAFTVSFSFFITPSFTSLLHGIRARPLRTAYKSYLRKRLTNSTLRNEIEQRLSPVDGSPRGSSRAKSFRSSTPSPNSSPFQTPHRRQSVNDLRIPNQFSLTLSPSHYHMAGSDEANQTENNCLMRPRKVRSFLQIPSQQDMQEFWSSLRKPNRSPTIIITHELRSKHSSSSLGSSKSSTPPFFAEHLV